MRLLRLLFPFLRFYTWLIVMACRVLYGMKIDGLENLPKKGPFLLLINEAGEFATTILTMMTAQLVFSGRMDTPWGIGDEMAWMQRPWLFERYSGSRPVSRGLGMGAAPLLVMYQALKSGKVVSMNPAGQMSFDGRLVPFRPGAAWLALRTAVPVVVWVSTSGSYDVCPFWQKHASLRGRFSLRMGKPFRLTETPLATADDATIKEANRRLMAEFEALYYDRKEQPAAP